MGSDTPARSCQKSWPTPRACTLFKRELEKLKIPHMELNLIHGTRPLWRLEGDLRAFFGQVESSLVTQ